MNGMIPAGETAREGGEGAKRVINGHLENKAHFPAVNLFAPRLMEMAGSLTHKHVKLACRDLN